MSLPIRVHRVPVHEVVLSIYPTGKSRLELTPLCKTSGGKVTPWLAEALYQLHCRVQDAGGDFRVTGAYRSYAMQAAAREKYERWVAAGNPKRSDPAWNEKTMKAAFVAKPGSSLHNAASATDLDYMRAAPAAVAKDKKLDWLWEQMEGLGFTAIISEPDEKASESWHFNCYGPWAHVAEKYGQTHVAMCIILDIGEGDWTWKHWVQAQIHRLGADIGKVDGVWGKKTRAGASVLGVLLGDEESVSAAFCAMSVNPGRYLWEIQSDGSAVVT